MVTMARTAAKTPSFCALVGGVLVLALAGRSSASPYYSVTVLDSYPGGSLNYGGLALNNLGQVVGLWSEPASSTSPGGDYPYLYDPTAGGHVTLLGLNSPSGLSSSTQSIEGQFTGINDLGQAIGESWQTGNSILYSNSTHQTINLTVMNYAILTNNG
jgi:hypothetical protein